MNRIKQIAFLTGGISNFAVIRSWSGAVDASAETLPKSIIAILLFCSFLLVVWMDQQQKKKENHK